MSDAARKRAIQEYYAKRSKDYDRQKSRTWKTSEGFSAQVVSETISALATFGKELVLEVGVGSGRNALPLMEKVDLRFVGLDLSREMLSLARSKMLVCNRKLSLILGDAENLSFVNEAFDAVICMSTMHYSSFQAELLKKFSTLMKKRGTLLYGDLTAHESDDLKFLETLERTLSKAHSRYYKPTEMQRLIQDSGFRVTRTKTIAYRKSYRSLMEDKGDYFHVKPDTILRFAQNVSAETQAEYMLTDTEMTLYYTMIVAQKTN